MALLALVAGCSGNVVDGDKPCGPNTSSTIVTEQVRQGSVQRIDVLLSIDNSRSMADKQQILALAVPDLVKGLVNPGCVDAFSGEVVATPQGPLDACPSGTVREFDPVLDIHIGIVSSSLGGHGSDACVADVAGKESYNDRGRLIARKDPATPDQVETYQALKFLAWDPAQQLTPPGEADVDADTGADLNGTALVPILREMVIGVGQIGCGYESQLESWYRFLVDPSPPETVTLDGDNKVLLMGTDAVLLDQRKSFLRPDSLLAILMLTDENDCSIKEQGQFYYAAQQKGPNGGPFHLPKARSLCDTDPNDTCCYSCGQKGPVDNNGNPVCPADPTCKAPDGKDAYHDDLTDNINLRCWDQKRRFGIDFLYPVTRYVDALRSQTVVDRVGQVVANPLFSDLDPSDSISQIRSSDRIMLAGIVGVPWQDIARTNKSGVPDLAAGLGPDGVPRGGFKTPDEMSALLPGKDYTTWDLILGNPDEYPAAAALPRDPLMLETFEIRTGQNPVTADPLVTSGTALGNKINGHEWAIPKRDDLQYACIFPLVQVDPATGQISPGKYDCSQPGVPTCDCEEDNNDNPLCEVNPATGLPTDQVRAKAYPGIRHLQVLRGVGSQGVVASVCPAQIVSPDAADFGYRPAVGALLERLGSRIVGECFGRTLGADPEGRVDCVVIEGRSTASCDCSVPGRIPVPPDHQGAVTAMQQSNPSQDLTCFCEIPQLENGAGAVPSADCVGNYDQPGYELCACQHTPPQAPVLSGGSPVDGWCYVDPDNGVGSSAVVDACPSDDRRILRFVGAGSASGTSTLFISCNIEELHDASPTCE